MTDRLTPLKRALLAIETLQDRVAEFESREAEAIAVIGIGCRMPGGVDSPDALARLLSEGRDAIVAEPPVGRPGWPVAEEDQLPPAGYLVDDPGAFDPGLFGISPREAASIDPQHRIALECVWEALENAAIAPTSLKQSRTGVFVGITGSDYQRIQVRAGKTTREHMDVHFASGAALSMASGRISYVLGLQGPAVSIDTACSSALVAVHLACQSLRSRESDLAAAGGTNLILSTDLTIAFQESRMLAPDGRCKTFDARANGFARGEGCGMLVLKRLSDALRDGDPIWAVVRGSAVNQDGPSSGLTAPNGPAQVAVITTALANARLAPADVGYVEAHGTGTELGDPIEVQALGAAYGRDRVGSPLLIGTVKSNLGHLEGASGAAGLIKAILAVRSGEIPASLHFETPNPLIPWQQLPVRVAARATSFPAASDGKRRAGVSAFGFSGTNAHVIVEQPPAMRAAEPGLPARRVHVLPMSARTKPGLRAVSAAFATALEEERVTLADLCHTAGVGRAHQQERVALLCRGTDAAGAALRRIANGEFDHSAEMRVGRAPVDVPRPVFLFTGQGAQHIGMGRGLYQEEPVFRAVLDRCDEVLREDFGIELLATMLGDTPECETALQRTGLAQPALFATDVALAELWRSWGVRPAMVIGHSVGEYAAAVVAGAMSLEDGARLIGERARLMDGLAPGGMMASITADEPTVRQYLSPERTRVGIAAINGPESIVISGDEEAVTRVIAKLDQDGIESVPLRVSHAFHSHHVEPILTDLQRAVDATKFSEPRIPLISNLTGQPLKLEELRDPEYWARHAREPVQFYAALQYARERGHRLFLECGPTPILCGLGAQADDGPETQWIGSLRRGQDDGEQIALAVAALYVAGVEIDWATRDRARGSRRVPVPTYPFQRESLWVQLPAAVTAEASPARRKEPHPLLGYRLITPDQGWRWECSLSRSTLKFLADHVVDGRVIVPAAAYFEMALAASRAGPGWRLVEITDVTIRTPLVLGDSPHAIQVRLEEDNGHARLTIHSLGAQDEACTLHVDARVRPINAESSLRLDRTQIAGRCTHALDAGEFYTFLQSQGLDFGPAFRGVRKVSYGDREACGEIALSGDLAIDAGRYVIHPALLDAGLQIAAAAVRGYAEARGLASSLYLPVTVERVRLGPGAGVPAVSHVMLEDNLRADGGTLTASFTMENASGQAVLTVDRLVMKRAGLRRESGAPDPADAVYGIEWMVEPGANREAPTLSVKVEPLARQLDNAMPGLARDHALEHYDRLYSDLERLATAYAVEALAALGWRPRSGDRVNADELLGALGILPRHKRLLQRFLTILAEDGKLARQGRDYVVHEVPSTGVQPMLDDMLRHFGESAPELEITRRCGQVLAEVLTGRQDPLAILFPGGDSAIMTRLYRETPIALAMNALVRQAVESVVAGLPEGRKLRVLEIGAGTGGTTAHVLPILPADSVEYTFTDIGAKFVAGAETEFGGREQMRFATLDIDRDPIDQGFQAEAFDLVLASNVMHASKDLRQSLGRVAELLAPGGILLALEAVQPQRWHDVTVGLLEGWWAFTDTQLRPEYALLDRPAWLTLLGELEFVAAATNPTADPDSVLGMQSVLFAQKPVKAARTLAKDRRNWLVLSDRGGTGDALVARLRQAGATTTSAAAATAEIADETGVDPLDRMRRILEHAARDSQAALTDVVYCGALDCSAEGPKLSALDQELSSWCAGALRLVQVLAEYEGAAPRLHLITRAAVPAGSAVERLNPYQASLWGMARAVREERPEIDIRTIDLPARAEADIVDRWLAALMDGGDEPEVALRGSNRLVPRLRPVSMADRTDSGAPTRLDFGPNGTFEELRFVAHPRQEPGEGEIEVRIEAAGLNFRDVMHALGAQYVGTSLGGECVGVVCAVGAGVDHLQVGDRVMAAIGAFGDYVTMNAGFAVPVPANLSIAAAATMPIAFLTADFALTQIGRMRRGETILIHAAAGGVGMAALQLAQAAGLRVLATAGSWRKRALIKALGADEVFDSRSVEFAEGVLAATGGRGVDIVLNSLAGEFIPASLRTLAADGRMLELGKTGIWTQAQVDACDGLKQNLQYHVVDLSPLLASKPETIQPRLQEIAARVERGEIAPLPHRVVPMSRAADAFRDMAAGRHIGKLVLVREGDLPVRSDGTYLVTGGLAGLGLLVAAHLAERGAGRLLLVGRNEPDEASREVIEQLRATGVTVDVVLADAGKPDELMRILALADDSQPLRGVVHSAGVLDDALLPEQSWGRFRHVFGAKVFGGAALAAGTATAPLDFFVFFSSVSGVFGAAGQANHSAANAFLDALAADLVAAGRPALSIAWGAWSGTGAAVRRGSMTRVSRRGVLEIEPRRGLDLFERLAAGTTGAIVASPMDWNVFLAASGRRNALVDHFAARSTAEAAAGAPHGVSGSQTISVAVAGASPRRRARVLRQGVERCVARILGLPADRLPEGRQPLGEVGLDSLLAVELRNTLAAEVGESLPASLLFDFPTIEALVEHLGQRLGLAQGDSTVQTRPVGGPPAPDETARDKGSLSVLDMIEGMTDVEVAEKVKGRAGGDRS